MSDEVDAGDVDHAWREQMLALIAGSDRTSATEALLSLAYHETDRKWLEDTLLGVVDGDFDIQVRQLAVICLGHAARIHRATTPDKVAPKLIELQSDPRFAARANNALADIETFTRGARR